MNNGAVISGSGRERLAWAFLLASFTMCICFTLAVPLGVNATLQNTKRLLNAFVQANQGTVRVDDETGRLSAIPAGEPGQRVIPGASILTDSTATALVYFSPPDSDLLLARLQVYSNTTVRLQTAHTPRFQVSRATQDLALELDSGRLRLALLESRDRPLIITLTTPHGDVTISEPGQYSLEVNNVETQVAVQEGRAILRAMGKTLNLLANQRAEIPTGAEPVGPLDTERNLVQNGDFNDGLDKWRLFVWNVELADQPKGETEVRSVVGDPALYFIRQGEGHADVRVRQVINQDVTDFASLQLFLTFSIISQSLGVCGVQGSECPLFVRLDYVDQSGVARVWQHGFYAVGEVADDTPDACLFCAVVQSAHERVVPGQITFYETDLQAELARQGVPPPRFIESVSLIASGHTFEAEVLDLALMAEE